MKDCLIIGPVTALMYKDVYPLLRNKILTVTERSVEFYEDTHQEGKWLTTIARSVDMRRRQLTKTYNPDDYPRYDNAPEIIECTNKSKIPVDYQDKIGVPITFFFYYPELPYEILELRTDLKLNGKQMFARLIIKKKNEFQMDKYSIIDEISKQKLVEEIVYNVGGLTDDDLKDLVQDIYISLLEKEDELIISLYKTNQLKYYIVRMAKNNIYSKNSPYYMKYKKQMKNKIDIDTLYDKV